MNTKYCVEFQMGTMSVKVTGVEAMNGASVKDLSMFCLCPETLQEVKFKSDH